MATTEKVIVSAQVDTDVRAQLARLAAEGDRTLSAEIRRAIFEHVEHVDRDRETER